MKRLGVNSKIFLIVDIKGNILYSSVDPRNFEFSKKDIKNIIEGKKLKDLRKNYEIDIEKIDYEQKILYVISITYKNIEKIAFIDSLTKLYNRNLWEWGMKNQFYNIFLDINSLIIIDVDDLKDINDNLGHHAGDKCIKAIADSIKSSIRKDDLAFRYGGDEFVILLLGSNKEQATKVVERIKKTIIKKMIKGNIFSTISAGIATFKATDELHKAFQKADKIMYDEKKRKKIAN